MMPVIYKRLFEVRILHDFFLADETGASFYGLNEADRNARLDKVLQAGRYDVWNDLKIQPTAETVVQLRNQKMRLLKTALGFAVAVQVLRKEESGDLVYEPFAPLQDPATFAFHLLPVSANFLNFTNLPLRKGQMPLRYFFSNQSASQVGAAAVLPRAAAELDTSIAYEMGELVNDSGSVREVFFRPNGAMELMDIPGDGFVTVSDKLLLPRRFSFDFQTAAAGTVEFNLEDEAGNEVKKITKDFTDPVQFFSLDFSQTTPPNPQSIPDGNYTLTATRSGGFFKQYNIVFQDALANAPSSMGGMAFRVKTGNAAFDLLDTNGRLATRKLADGTRLPHRIFELRLLARKTFWRYRSKDGFSGSPPSPHLELIGNTWVTKRPKALNAGWQPFAATNGANLPNAEASSLNREAQRLYSDIFISAVNRFDG